MSKSSECVWGEVHVYMCRESACESYNFVRNLTAYQQFSHQRTFPRLYQQNEMSSSPLFSWESYDLVSSRPGQNAHLCCLYTHFHSSTQYNTMYSYYHVHNYYCQYYQYNVPNPGSFSCQMFLNQSEYV